jgi:hypothetical protein
MNLPQFNAEASMYRTGNRYRSSAVVFGGSLSTQSVTPALTYEDTVNCERCENKCNDQTAECAGYAVATWTAGLAACALSGPLYPICAAGVSSAYALAEAGCAVKLAICSGICNAPGESCCPVSCGLGHCCSTGETCLADGCCPSGQQVCGGTCCAPGASCCGGKCCAPGASCCAGTCCQAGVPCGADGGCAHFGGGPPPPPPKFACAPGRAPCGFPDATGVIRTCCPPGLLCCGYSAQFGPDCKAGTCIH